MAQLQRSGRDNVVSPPGNSLALLIDGETGELLLKDTNGVIEKITNYLPTGITEIIGIDGLDVTYVGSVATIGFGKTIYPGNITASGDIIAKSLYIDEDAEIIGRLAADSATFSTLSVFSTGYIEELTGRTASFSDSISASNFSGSSHGTNTGDQNLAPYQLLSAKGVALGYAGLDSNGKVPLSQMNDAILGNVKYQGLWNAATNIPNLTTVQPKGYYYIVSAAGTQFGITFEIGDWLISDGVTWGKVDNTDAVSSVAGLTGVISAGNLRSALSINNVDNTSDLNKPVSTATQTALNSYQLLSAKGVASGYASLDSSGKVPLSQMNDTILGNVSYQGVWNASTNSPNLTTVQTKGYYYIVSVAGTQFGKSFDVGDWIISNGVTWDKVDNTDAVSSVAGLTGIISAASLRTALSINNVDNTSDANKPISIAVSNALSTKEPIESGTGIQYYAAGVKSLITGTSVNMVAADGSTRTTANIAWFSASSITPATGPVTGSQNLSTAISRLSGNTQGVTDLTTVALSSATLNSTYPNEPIGFRVRCPYITLGPLVYEKATEAGTSDVWVSVPLTIVA